MPVSLQQWEQVEIGRSANEAASANYSDLLATENNCGRYLNPPANTAYPLEYSFNLLGDVSGKVVLEYGCGDGHNTLVLAKRGATIKALDISPELVKIARRRLKANGIDESCAEFLVASAHDIPIPDESVDIVFGIAILHHLDLALSSREVKRVLRKGGRAIFLEPVRNSKVIKVIRKLIPYKAPDVSPYERPLTDKELKEYAADFSSYRSKAFTLPTTSLVNIIPPLRMRFLDSCYIRDAHLLKKLPILSHYAITRVIEIVK